MSLGLRLGAVFLIILINAFFVAAEYALITARKSELESRAQGGSKRAHLALKLLAKPIAVISVCQVGVTVSSIVIGAVGEPLAEHLLKPIVVWGFAAVILGLSSITYLHVVFGELAPKAIALQRAEGVAMGVAWPVRVFSFLLHPLVLLFMASASIVARAFGVDPHSRKSAITSETELRLMIAAAEEENLIEEDEEELIYNVFDFGDLEAHDVMIARPSVLMLPLSATADEALQAVLASPYTRVPLWSDSPDSIVGILHARDLFACLYEHGKEGIDLEKLLRPALLIPETKKLSDLLQDLRREQQQMAIVLNEYGAVEGVVTMEDLLEELVGEIDDEFDEPGNDGIEIIEPKKALLQGSVTIEDFNDRLGEVWNVTLQNGDIHTISGFIFTRLGRAPAVGDAVATEELSFIVSAIDGNRIDKVEVTCLK
jgi:putative hemolysin